LRAVSAFERGEYEPAPDTLRRISRVLRFPEAFFAGPELHEPTPDTSSFRSMSRMSAARREAALAAGALSFLLNDWIEERFNLPAPDVLDLPDEDPAAAAMALRHNWGLGERPIRNMVHLMEAKGIRIFSLAEDTVDVDAFSLWRDQTPFVFLNTLKSAEHGRFDAAHELGHVVLHRHGGPQGRDTERQANQFASAFLMPRASILAHVPRFATLNTLVQLKKQWIVSVSALAFRLHAVGAISDWHYRTLFIEIAQRGWRTNEPEGAQRETSQLLAKVFAALRDDGVSKDDVARALHVDATEVDKLVFGLILVGVDGAGRAESNSSARPVLRLIEN
jgi:Zn-dependent peptidase ImmA (M78 family)